MKEQIVWKPIYLNGVTSDYEISNTGLVRNITNNSLRSPFLRNGYYGVVLYRHGDQYPCSIHRLVAEYFVPNPCPDKNVYVDHIDGNKLNNHYTNLEWVTPKENKQRAIKLGLDNPHHGNQAKGSTSGVSKHTESQAHSACILLEKGLTNKEISNMLGIDTEFVRSLKRGGWKHVTSQYNIPKPEKRNYYSDEIRNNIRTMIDSNLSDVEIANKLNLEDPLSYGRRYVNKIRSRYNRDKSSSTIPLESQ